MRTTEHQLLAIVKRLCILTNSAQSKTEATEKNLETFIKLDQSFDGFYSLWEVKTNGGTREQPFIRTRQVKWQQCYMP